MNKIKNIFTGEFIFAAFLFSSTFKVAFDDVLPVDLTVVLMVFSILIAFKNILQTKEITSKIVIPFILYGLLSAIVLFSLYYTPSSSYAISKAAKFLFLTGWSFIGCFFLVKNHKSLRLFLQSLAFIAVVTSAYLVAISYDAQFIRLGDDGGSVLGLAKIAGMGSIILLILYFYGKSTKRMKIIALAGIGLLIVTILLTASRMALVSFFVAALLVFILSIDFSKRDIRISKKAFRLLPLIPIGLVALIPLYRNGTIETMIMRIGFLFEDGGGSSVSERVTRYEASVGMFESSPVIGQGIGSFAINYSGIDERSYPHNMFFEFIGELGLIGTAVFLMLLLYSVYHIFKAIKSKLITPEQICLILLLIFQFLNINTTGDINDNRIFFAFLGMSFLLGNYYKSDELKTKVNTI